LTKTEILIIHTLCLWKSVNTSGLSLFENPWELTKETWKVSKSIRSNHNYSAILAMPSVTGGNCRVVTIDIGFASFSGGDCFIFMKQARPWMLANLKIIWQFHVHPVHQKVSRIFGSRYRWDDFFLGPNLVSFNRAVVPYEISKVNFRVETKILVSMSEEN
jgi:hypothetical protein